MRTIYIDGDSTTYGMADLEMGGWPNRLHVAMLRRTADIENMIMVANRAMPGRTLPGILREADANMAYYRRFGEVTAVLQTGMNEVKIFPGSSAPLIPARRFGEQVIRFCVGAFEKDCTPLLVGPPPIDTSHDNPTFSGAVIKDELLVEYGEIVRSVAASTGAAFVDTRAVFAAAGRPLHELLAPDGYHPGALGHAALATAVHSALPFVNQ
jgi:lysophospholipase L1-like esterase